MDGATPERGSRARRGGHHRLARCLADHERDCNHPAPALLEQSEVLVVAFAGQAMPLSSLADRTPSPRSSESAPESLISLRDVNVHYGSFHAVAGVTFDV